MRDWENHFFTKTGSRLDKVANFVCGVLSAVFLLLVPVFWIKVIAGLFTGGV